MKEKILTIIKWVIAGLLCMIAAWGGLKLIGVCTTWFGDFLGVVCLFLSGIGAFDVVCELEPWKKKEENEEPTEHPTED